MGTLNRSVRDHIAVGLTWKMACRQKGGLRKLPSIRLEEKGRRCPDSGTAEEARSTHPDEFVITASTEPLGTNYLCEVKSCLKMC